MTTYAGTSTSTTPGVSSTSAYAQPAVSGSNSSTGSGVYGYSAYESGMTGITNSASKAGIAGGNWGNGNGVWGGSVGSSYAGVYGLNTSSGSGVWGDANSSDAYSNGVKGTSVGTYGNGVAGLASGTFGVGVFGSVSGSATWAGYFYGDVTVFGSIYKSGGGFIIDHPLDPENKSLVHSFVESSERKTIYDGVAEADSSGEVVIQMPTWFEALNRDIRYQLTSVGAPAPNLCIKDELSGGRFVIGGAAPGGKVCWQVTGTRRDLWALANPLVAEVDKPSEERGLFRHPALFGQSESKGIAWRRQEKLTETTPPMAGAPGSP